MPARLGRIAAHAFGDDRQRGRFSRLCRQLQPSPGGQAERLRQLHHHKRQRFRAQGLFRDRQNLGLILRRRHEQPGGIKVDAKAGGVELFPNPGLMRPEHLPTHARRHCQGEKTRPRATCLMGAVLGGRKTEIHTRNV